MVLLARIVSNDFEKKLKEKRENSDVCFSQTFYSFDKIMKTISDIHTLT